MQTEIINHRRVTNLEELLDAVDVLQGDSDNSHASAVQVRCNGSTEVELLLQEETLSDGSKVYNIVIRGVSHA